MLFHYLLEHISGNLVNLGFIHIEPCLWSGDIKAMTKVVPQKSERVSELNSEFVMRGYNNNKFTAVMTMR